MPIEIKQLVHDITPEKTVLFFGAGSSIPSRAPSVDEIIRKLATRFREDTNGYNLREFASILEAKYTRHEMINELRKMFVDLQPSGGILNTPLYEWKSIYTTNYDDLIEKSYNSSQKKIRAISSNFDFSSSGGADALKYFKLHGTIDKDLIDGIQSRIIISDGDYDQTVEYREKLWDRFRDDISDSHLIIIGHSLADAHIKELIEKTAGINAISGVGKVSLFLYNRDDNRAMLYERRGFKVCFGGIDDFFAELAAAKPQVGPQRNAQDYFYNTIQLRATTQDVNHLMAGDGDAIAMFNGWPALYSDINSGLTFERDIISLSDELISSSDISSLIILGASGVGKTTAARQMLVRCVDKGIICWEHKNDFNLESLAWLDVSKALLKNDKTGVLFIDEAHSQLNAINELVDRLRSDNITSLKLICASSKNLWNPRIKSPNIYKHGKDVSLSQLSSEEIDRLLFLIENNSTMRGLTEQNFSGFSRPERKRRLAVRCESDMFVCLKNIFASEKFDDIILREYANLSPELQEIYKIVAAMESAGIRVHRQLIIRLLSISSDTIQAILINLSEIINEYTVCEREGIYGWKGRHSVIVDIIAKYKYSDAEGIISLFDKVIDCISPTYDIEIRTIRELCNIENGLQRISDKTVQNRLLRKMISIAPGERLPRHRLIRNMIDLGEFDKAETEIRIFDKDFKYDSAIMRYKISLLTARAINTAGIMNEDRITILREAEKIAIIALQRDPDHKYILSSYCSLGLEIYKKSKDITIFDDAIKRLKQAEERTSDPEISKLILKFERNITGQLGSDE
ncbi:SIR2 family protein [Serratia oryzae]|uniref:SIR2 family protein n=1 Tax=Serratia oryzae TaxID=2034155 RepID=UPI0012E302F7|nr:SIR2 family protein [Serratia oryzae]